MCRSSFLHYSQVLSTRFLDSSAGSAIDSCWLFLSFSEIICPVQRLFLVSKIGRLIEIADSSYDYSIAVLIGLVIVKWDKLESLDKQGNFGNLSK